MARNASDWVAVAVAVAVMGTVCPKTSCDEKTNLGRTIGFGVSQVLRLLQNGTIGLVY
jgi:hypothetical protein